MNDVLIRPYKRRSRCDIPGCKCFAAYEIGPRPNRPIMVLCEQHTEDLYRSINSAMIIKFRERAKEKEAEAATAEPVVVEPEVAEEPVAEVETVDRAPRKRGRQTGYVSKPVADEPGKDFYTCKYCGEKFDKFEMSAAEFAQHSKRCKKEHMENDVADGK